MASTVDPPVADPDNRCGHSTVQPHATPDRQRLHRDLSDLRGDECATDKAGWRARQGERGAAIAVDPRDGDEIQTAVVADKGLLIRRATLGDRQNIGY